MKFLDRIRERKREVILILDKSDVNLLGLIVRNPNALPLRDYGMKEYHCADENEAKNFIRLKKWLEEKVMNPKYKEGTKEIESFDIKESVEVGLKQVYVEFLLKVVMHYKPIGNATTFSISFWPVVWKLEGKTVAEDDPSE